MTNRKSARTKPRTTAELPIRSAKSEEAPAAHRLPSGAAIRETVESIVVAFILAFLFRTFEAEAFVIPTGSMAPTLMGRHKDVLCPKCGCSYQVSASEDEEQMRGRVVSGTCPMCRYTASLLKGKDKERDDPAYSGDRILVGKLAYDFKQPDRWDVVVFKYPGGAATNFIKRLVGLPGETIRIQNGDIWVRRPEDKDQGDAGFKIARKPPQKLLAMLQPVFDNDYMPKIAKYGWPARWYCDPQAATCGWTSEDSTFHSDGAAGENWLRYHHLAPSYAEWRQVAGRPPRAPRPAPQWITDFTAYDTGWPEEPDTTGAHWVGDLAMACAVEAEKSEGELALELCKGGRQFQCRIDLATGRATLSISGRDMQQWRPAATTKLRGKGRHDVMFSNCDNELRLWVDGGVVAFDSPTTYPDLDNWRPTNVDLAPVGVASKGAAVRISHLRVFRDLYYIAESGDGRPQYIAPPGGHVDFSLESLPSEPERFFVLGDNSPKSKDSRLWGTEYWVSRELMIGKALFIYWPHPLDEIRTPWGTVPFQYFPYLPNFSRMRLVR